MIKEKEEEDMQGERYVDVLKLVRLKTVDFKIDLDSRS